MNLSEVENMTLDEMIASKVINVHFEPSMHFPNELSLDDNGEPNFTLASSYVSATSLDEVIKDPMSVINAIHGSAIERYRYSCKPKVLRSKPAKKGHIYLMANERNGYTKIGFTTKDPVFRESTLQSEEPEVVLIWQSPKIRTMDDESDLHRKFHDFRIRGEWFNLNEDQINLIKRDYGVRL